jgi:hypothetical protein
MATKKIMGLLMIAITTFCVVALNFSVLPSSVSSGYNIESQAFIKDSKYVSLATPFVVYQPQGTLQVSDIVIAKNRIPQQEVLVDHTRLRWYDVSESAIVSRAAGFVAEALGSMTGE